MAAESLANQVEAYNLWKRRLKEEIANYQVWLHDNALDTDDLQHRLLRGLELLQEDQLTIAFVGEYSRGKTELINALVFAEFGQRMLPSQAGRTTMCPTEIFFDAERNDCYLRLLPIETRLENKSIQHYKSEPEAWHEIPIDITDPDKMSFSLKQVAATRSATLGEARNLGFDESRLEKDTNNPNRVIVPAWRHAQISLDSPLLKKGLRILDTPGLNALGSEPELTVSMIPRAQAVVFILSADAGVTASDLSIWEEYINTEDADHRAGRFAVLNKIDVLWDDLQGERHTAESIEAVRKTTADHLGIRTEDVLPLSAKQGLIARVKKDDLLLQKSALGKLEKLISQRVLVHKETLIYDALVHDVIAMLHNSQAILNERLADLYDRYEALSDASPEVNSLQDMADRTHQDHDRYYKKLITLKSSRRLMQSQGEILQQLISPQTFDGIVRQTQKTLRDSWSTLGMSRAMDQFFVSVEQTMDNVCMEAKLADKMVAAVYQRFTADINAQHLHPKTFSIKRERQRLRQLRERARKFRRHPRAMATEQTILIDRFFETFVQETRRIHHSMLKEAKRWPDEALLPLMQYTLEQKQRLQNQVSKLKTMAQKQRTVAEQQEDLRDMIDTTHQQLKRAEQIQQQLSEPPAAVLAQ